MFRRRRSALAIYVDVKLKENDGTKMRLRHSLQIISI